MSRITPEGFRYTVVSNGALPSVPTPPIEFGIARLLQADKFTTNQSRFGRKVTTRKTRIA